jgi:ABC-2 type transport system permease protein
LVDARDSRPRPCLRGVGDNLRNLVSNARVAWYAIISGANDYWAIFTLKSWIFGWCVRMISQVSLFALIGKLLRSDQQTQFLLIGNAVVIAAAGATFAMFMTTSERGNGTLSLLLASPSRPVVVFAARGAYVMADGVFSSLLGLFILGPAFGLQFPFPRILLVIPLTLLVGTSAYCFSTFLAGVILRYREITGLLVNATIVTLMALCGVNVPVSFYPDWLAWISRCLPITNGLEAIRSLIDGEAWSTIGAHAGAEVLVAAAWLLLALATFGRFMARGQRDGSLEYAS